MSLFTGSCVALVTPFHGDSVDFAALEKLLNFHLNHGTDAILVLGTTGESSTMTSKEKESVIRFSVEKVDGKVPLFAGTGTNCTHTSIENSLLAQELGVDGVLLVTPYYNKCSQAGLEAHYRMIADNIDIPAILYNVPSRTGVNITPSSLEKLADHPNIAAIKEASGNIAQVLDMARRVEGKMDIYSGNDDQIVPILSAGGKGVISVLANIMPQQTSDMVHKYLNGDVDIATKMQLDFMPLVHSLFMDVNPIPVKEAMELMGMCSHDMRLPLCPMQSEQLEALKTTLKAYQLIK